MAFSFSYDTPSALLTPDEIYGLADEGELLRRINEDRRLERKPPGIHARVLGEYICMWANTAPDGGLVVVGLGDHGEPLGCSALSQNQLNDIDKAGFIYCSEARTENKRVEVRTVDGRSSFLILMRVYYREDKVVFDSSSHAYVRIGDQKHELTTDEIRELQIDKGQLDFEQEPSTLVYPDEFDLVLMRKFLDGLRRLRQPLEEHDDVELLQHRHLGEVKDGRFTPNNACVLLFSKNPLGAFPGCKVVFLRVDGEVELSGDQYNIVKRVPLEGPIPALIEDSARVIGEQLREFSRLDKNGKFFSAPEYPKPAWFEALVNACVHRSYGLRNMNIFVKMFDDKLVVESPGGFPPTITPENIIGAHSPRNPHLMDAMFYLDLVKEHGEGTRRMRDTMVEMNLPQPEFRQTETVTGAASVRVTLRNNVKQRKVWVDADVAKVIGDALASQLGPDERRVLNFVVEHKRINVSECLRLEPELKYWHNAKRLLSKMTKRGLLRHNHNPKLTRDSHAYYMLPEKLGGADMRQSS